ncbi:ribonuclease H-like protein [Eremomyces bilateralis CBS 781.70]|uniref:Ribonuclease H-like protein n=1 Tax=Eremomyces bilateralis CBS 781.70 TaxID=1392243 RepID=A0A6G1FX81_9PEZI|nr:ribonuclease H-like protein [Eremomyces bilateralis CBS 781.70]KAF1810393.1 ribonuclease H-like protein [Eremomyces bilateralis CBS 781.70]
MTSTSSTAKVVQKEKGNITRQNGTSSQSETGKSQPVSPSIPLPNPKELAPGKYVSLDCEMVGTGPPPNTISIPARVSIVNYHLHVLLDVYVLPTVPVTDYRTHVSGILPHHLTPESGALPLKDVKKLVRDILRGRVLVGHAIHNDLIVLSLDSEVRRGQLVKGVRDTCRYRRFRDMAGGRTPALRNLVRDVLGVEMRGTKIQEDPRDTGRTESGKVHDGVHDSVEDSRMTMQLYKLEKEGMDREMSKRDFGLHAELDLPVTANGAKGHRAKASNGDEDDMGSIDDSDFEVDDTDDSDADQDGGVALNTGETTVRRAAKPRRKKKKKAKKRTKRA